MKKGAIRHILTALKSTSGSDFLERLTLQLHEIIGSDYTYIARLNEKDYTSTTLSLVAHGDVVENFSYSLENTPCADVNGDSMCIYTQNICSFYPEDRLLMEMNVEGYIGTPLHDSKGNVMGLVVALYERKIQDSELVTSLFELFSGRISAEIERMENEDALAKLNSELEQKVHERTQELQQTLEQLESSQGQLIENEKLAALGRLVAGVAHEVNTPLGVALLGCSTIEGCYQTIKNALDSEALAKHTLEQHLEMIREAQDLIMVNLTRTNELMSNFKQLASDLHMDEVDTINLSTWIESFLSGLLPFLNMPSIQVIRNYPESRAELCTCPSRLAQVLTNIITNAVNHAFDDSVKNKTIFIQVTDLSDHFVISIKDNGLGMKQEIVSQIYDPFFTTKRGKGGTGLGMSIVRNIIMGPLNGSIDIETAPGQGTEVLLNLPKK